MSKCNHCLCLAGIRRKKSDSGSLEIAVVRNSYRNFFMLIIDS